MSELQRVEPTGYAKLHDEVWVGGEQKAFTAEIPDIDILIAVAETAGRNIVGQTVDHAA